MAYHNRNAINKYRKIQDAYHKLYSQGYRFDYIVPKLAAKFDLSNSRIEQILRMDIPQEAAQMQLALF